jgi:hypothetical protein
MKNWLIIAVAVIVILSSCPDPSNNNPNKKPDEPDNQETTIIFDNTQGICTVLVYDYYQRREEDKIAEVPPGHSSGEIEWAPGDRVPFYFSYSINFKGISGFTLDYVPEIGKDQKAVRIDADMKTTIKIPPLSETFSSPDTLLSNNSFLFIKNNSFFSFKLHRGNSELKPDNISSSVVNDGETARYAIDPGAASNFQLLVGANYYSFPNSLVNFEAGHIYKFEFNGSISQVSDTELKLENVTGVAIPQTPDAPVVITSNGRIALQWAAVESATAYEIWMSTANDPATAVKYGDDISTSLSAAINGLNNGTAYYIWLKAKNILGTSGFSPATMGIPSASTVKPPNPQTPPAIIAGDGQLAVSWQAVAEASVYEIWAGTANYVQAAAKQGEDVADFSTMITGLNNGTSYYVWIRAKNNIGISGFSSPASGKPLGTPGTPTLTPGYKSLTVSWAAVAGADQYEVYYGIGTPTTLAITTAGTTATISGLIGGTVYYVRLRARNASGVSDYGPGASGVPDDTLTPGLYRDGVKIGEQNLSTALSWISANAVSGDDFYIVLGANESISPKSLSYSGKTVGITLMGSGGERTISLSANGSMFTVNSRVTLTLDENITLMGRSANNASLVLVNSSGNLIMNDGAKITGNNSGSSDGGGIYVVSGNFTMNGGMIRGNNANESGGGIFVNSGTVTMNGGTISKNNARYGGGIHALNSIVIINDGIITGNTANRGGNGGGIYVNSDAIVTMHGGTIGGNTGSGVGIFEGVFKKLPFTGGGQNSGIIYGSEATGVDADGVPLKNTSTNNQGHAVYTSTTRMRNTTAGQTDHIDSTTGRGLSASGNPPFGQ